MSIEVERNPWKMALGGGDRLRDKNGYRIRAVGVCFRGNGEKQEILLVSSGPKNDLWSVPGGGVDKDETHEEAAAREVLEEAGVTCAALNFVGIITDEHKRNHTSIFIMSVSEEHDVWEEGILGRKREWHLVSEACEFLQEKHLEVLKLALSTQQ